MKLFEVSDQKVFLNKPFIPPQFWSEQKDREEFIERHKKAFINSEELSLLNSKGKKIYLVISSSFTKDIHGKINGIQGLVRNITQEKDIVSLIKAQEALQKSEEKYRLITENASDLIAVTTFTLNPKYTYMSPSHKTILGYDPKKYTGKAGFDIIHPDDKKKILPLIRKYLKARAEQIISEKFKPQHVQIEYRVKDIRGRWHDFECRVTIIKDELLLVSRDITEKKILENEKEKYTALLEEKTTELETSNIKLKDAGDKLNSHVDLLERFKKATIDDVLEMKKIEDENNDLKEELRRLKHED